MNQNQSRMTTSLRACALALTLLLTWQPSWAAPEAAETQEVVLPVTQAMQEALRQSTAQQSEEPLNTLLATVPASERVTLALSLFLTIDTDAEARSRVGAIILHSIMLPEGITSKHVRLLTEAYLYTVAHPLPMHYFGLGSDRPMDDQLFQFKTLTLLSAYLGVHHPYIRDVNPSSTPLNKLQRVFAEAQQASVKPAEAARLQACQSLLPLPARDQ